MTRPRVKKIEIQGFRSFGKLRQSCDLPDTVSVLWGGNSQGKTSFAEALEFLFTGQIARRELLASAKDEFSEALRNAHIAPEASVVVEADILCGDGKTRRLKRTLIEDYKRGGAAGCTSRLEIDGVTCAEHELEAKLGIKLSQAPLRAPVLTQHTLGYVFSASPIERSNYFRAILDTQDLEDFRKAVATLPQLLKAPELLALTLLAVFEAAPAFTAAAARLRKAKNEAEVATILLETTSTLLTSVGIEPLKTLVETVVQLETELGRRRSQTFPLDLLTRKALLAWGGPSSDLQQAIEAFLKEKAAVSAEAQRFVDLFRAALALPDHDTDHAPLDCPLCAAKATLTQERLTFIVEQVRATEGYTAAAEALQRQMRFIDGQLDALIASLDQALPKFMSKLSVERRKAGFSLAAIRKLVPDQDAVTAWSATSRQLWRASRQLRRGIAAAKAELHAAIENPSESSGQEALAAALKGVQAEQGFLETRMLAYAAAAAAIQGPLEAAVDESTQTKGWAQLIALGGTPADLWTALLAAAAHAAKVKAHEKALAEIDAGIGIVTDEKFDFLSKAVRSWWDKLRPDEPVFFDAVKRRSSAARRNIDLRVGLAAKEDRSDTKFRDAVAVLSQSQLHCLGLSLFLARAVQEGTGFIVLDDPVLTSDDDYRPNFASSVIEALLAEGLQVVICSQDYKSCKDIGHRWEHKGVGRFQIVRNDPVLGSEIRSESDTLATMLAKAQPFVKSADPVLRKEGAAKLREAIERFCKVMLVKDRQFKGDSSASITDYDGKNFSDYGATVMNLLTQDPAHPGKLKAAHAYVTPGPHDDKPPSKGELAGAFGDIKAFKRDYLD